MNRAQAEKQIVTLRSAINRHDRLYYVEARPEVSDREYDRLYAELKKLEAQFPDLVTLIGARYEPAGEVEHFLLLRRIR